MNAGRLTVNEQVDRDFNIRKSATHDKTPFKIFEDPSLTGDRLEAMKFLYAYMPLPDIAGYSPEFILENVDLSLKAREEMPWGKDIPEREFLYFVLPLRMNNEPLDSARKVFYNELKDRVKGMTIEEAILETNHWCHEKVSYRPSNGRTSSPLSAVSQAIGRCGEESTFTVAALRSIGIPARQVYTPRWAHTDDNHAWVEAYANGKWHFLGACEPEPVLDLGWFNEPASRGILMNTNVIGKYDGPEERLSQNNIITTINVTENYTTTDTIKARVIDIKGNPVENCKVNFCVYNYAEFYPVATKSTDNNGEVSLISGHGDMILWATDGENFGFTKGNSANNETVDIIMDKPAGYEGTFELLITPSGPQPRIPAVTEEQRRINNLRFAAEDSVRNAYIATFANEETAANLAQKLNLDSKKIEKILVESRGNHQNLTGFLSALPAERREDAMNILLAVTEKDRRDIPLEVLFDTMQQTVIYPDSAIRIDYILNPRIEREPLVAYKTFFEDKFDKIERSNFINNPELLVKWVEENIEINPVWNPQNLRMDPVSVWNQRETTKASRNIFFVALARSLGIPARIDPVTSNTLYLDSNNNWIDAFPEIETATASPKGKIRIDFTPEGRITDPLYYSQFSISRFVNGVPVQLEFDETDRVSSINSKNQELDAGKYMMLSGQRMADGSVLTRGTIFNLPPDTTLTVSLVIPQDSTALQVIGSLNAENVYHDLAVNLDKSLLSTTGRGFYVFGIIRPNHEPSKHILNDMILASKELEENGTPIMLLFPTEEDASLFDISEFKGLPSTVHFGIDNEGVSQAELRESLGIADAGLPIITVADTFNRIVYVTTGYTIGSGERLLDVLSRLQ